MNIKAVIDTNVFVSAFWSKNIEAPPIRIYRALMERRFTPLYSEEIVPAAPDDEIFPDPADKIFYCVALAAQDDFAKLVTGNAKHYPPAPFVVTPAEFTKFIA